MDSKREGCERVLFLRKLLICLCPLEETFACFQWLSEETFDFSMDFLGNPLLFQWRSRGNLCFDLLNPATPGPGNKEI